MEKRAYATLSIKAVADSAGKRTFSGIASSVTPDRMDDIVEPKGAEFDLPIALLWQHNSREPIGWVRKVKVTDKQIEIDGEVHNEAEPGKLKDRLDEVWQMLKSGLVRGLSIGFNPKEYAWIKETGGMHVLRWAWHELSAVTIPAHQEASILSIKSIDEKLLAAQGRGQGARQTPGVSGNGAAQGGNSQPRSKGNRMKTLAELREERTQKADRLKEIKELWTAEDRRSTDDEATEFDQLSDEIKALDDDIRVKQFDAVNAAAARVVRGKSAEEGSSSRGGSGGGGTFYVKRADPDDKFKGQAMTRLFIAKAGAYVAMKEGNYMSAADIAQHRWGKSHPNLVRYIKAAVAGGGTDTGEWGAELAVSDTRYTGDFVEFLYAMTVFDRLPLRAVPRNVHIKGQDGASTAYWRGQSKALKVTTADFSDVDLRSLSLGAIAVCSKELIADSDPSAELWIRDSLGNASAQLIDTTFLSATAASAGVSPAGILNTLSPITSNGTDAAGLRSDIAALYAPFITAKNSSGLVLVTTPTLAKSASLMVNALGQPEFPTISGTGGTLLGDPVYVGDNVGAGDLILLKPSDIWKIGDSGVQVSMSDTAMVEQDGAPTGATDTPVAASATMVSLWQEESIGFKIVRRINYQKRRASAVAYVGDAAYHAGT